MKHEEQTCIKDSLIYISASWLLITNNKKSYKFWCSFLLHVEIMDILHNNESLCFVKRGAQLNNKLETSFIISNLTLKFLT
jgi:hypothetical protein